MHCVNAVLFLIIFFFIHDSANYDFVNLRPKLSYQYVYTPKLEFPKLNFCDIVVLSTFCILTIYWLYISFLHCSYLFRYVKFSNNLSTLKKKSLVQNQISINLPIFLLLFIAVLSTSVESLFVLLTIMLEIGIPHNCFSLHTIFKHLLTINCRWKALNNFTLKFGLNTICYLFLLLKRSLHSMDTFLLWVIFLLIILSNDIEKSPGDFINVFLVFVIGI